MDRQRAWRVHGEGERRERADVCGECALREQRASADRESDVYRTVITVYLNILFVFIIRTV